MLDGLFSRGFTSKCKSSIKLIKARIDLIVRKRNAMQKFLKKDIADLLANGLDTNAYGRAEGLLVELNRSSCYDLVEQFCDCVWKQISVMQNSRECPEECKGAVQSLIFAAARFADLPELRDLRKLFTERYGSSLESFLNKEFAEKMAAKPFTREKKLQLMRDVAVEFSIKWDSKAFEQKKYKPSASVQDRPKKQGSFHDSNNGYKMHDDMEDTVPKKKFQDVSLHGRRELTHDEYKSHNDKEDTVPKKDNQRTLSNGRPEFGDDGYRVHNSTGDTILRRDRDVPTHGKRELTGNGLILPNENCNGGEDTFPENYNKKIPSHARVEVSSSFTRIQQVKSEVIDDNNQNSPKNNSHSIHRSVKEKTESLKPFCDNVVPPPYVKPRGSKYRTNPEAQGTSSNNNEASSDPPYSNRDVWRTEKRSEHVDHGGQLVGSAGVNGHGDERDHHRDDLVRDAKSKPRSVRSHLKPTRRHDSFGNSEQEEKRNPDTKRQDGRRGLDDNDSKHEEDEIMDKLLVHYSKKKSTYEPSKMSMGLKAPTDDTAPATGLSPRHSSRGEGHYRGLSHPPARAASLPPEPTTPTQGSRGPARASSFQPDGQAGHVHPKLPDYDDLAARIAALTER